MFRALLQKITSRRFVLSLLGVFGVVLISVFMLNERSRWEQRSEDYEYQLQLDYARIFAGHLQRHINLIDAAARLLTAEYRVRHVESLPLIAQTLREGALQQYSLAFSIADDNGNIIYSDPPRAGILTSNVASTPFFRYFAHSGKRDLYISAPYSATPQSEPVLQFVRPVYTADSSNHFAGIVMVSVLPKDLTDFANQLALGKQSSFTVTNESGVILSRSIGLTETLGKPITSGDLRKTLHSGEGIYRGISPLDGQERLVAYRRLDESPLIVYVARSPESLQQQTAPPWPHFIAQASMASLILLLLLFGTDIHLRRREEIAQKIFRESAHLTEAQRIGQLGSWEWPLNDHRAPWWSEQFYRLLGLENGSRISYKRVLALVHPADRNRFGEAVRNMLRHRASCELEYRIRLPSGEERTILQRGTVVYEKNEGKPFGIFGTIQDITAYRRLENSLRDAERRLKLALEGANEGVWEWNIQEGILRFASNCIQIFGYDRDDVRDTTIAWNALTHPEDLPQLWRTTSYYLLGDNEAYVGEYRMRRRDGSWCWLSSRGRVIEWDKNGLPLRALGTYSDISERKRTELALAESEARFRTLFDVQAEGVLLIGKDGIITAANGAAERILDYHSGDLTGMPLPDISRGWEMLHEDGSILPLEEHPAIVALHTGRNCDQTVVGLRRASGRITWLSISSRPLFSTEDRTPYAAVTSFSDITPTKDAELTNRMAQAVFDNVSLPIIVTDGTANIIAINPAFSTTTGYPRETLIGRRPNVIRSNRHGNEFYQEMWRQLKQEGHWEGEIWNRRKSGEPFPFWLSIVAVGDASAGTLRYIGIYSDLTKQKQIEHELWTRANFDPLTQLPNRLLFNDRLATNFPRARREKTRLALLFIDLDRFKPINDTYGHQAGDAVLQAVARRLQDEVRETDTVARLAGDEFVILLPHLNETADAERVARAIIDSLAKPIAWKDRQLEISCSIGIAIFPDDADTVETLIAHADSAMYQAKHDGRSTYAFYMSGTFGQHML